MTNSVVNIVNRFIDKIEPEYTFRLVDIIYCNRRGHEVCVMQLVGKNSFPKFTPEEILDNEKAMIGLSSQDVRTITQLDCLLKERKKRSRVLEYDRNGSIVLKDSSGNVKRYSEKYISSNREMLDKLDPKDAHDIGYRVGFREGLSISAQKNNLSVKMVSKLSKFIPKIIK